jgi:Uma2 family endonuclease
MSTQTRQVETNVDASDALPDPDRLYRMPLEMYHGIAEHGLLTPRDKVVLLDGLLVNKYAPSSQYPESAWPEPDIWPERLYRMPLEVYHGIAEHGLLTPRDKVVLLDGLLVNKMTKGGPHVVATNLVWDALRGLVPDGWFVTKEDPVALPGAPLGLASEPEPDLSVVRGGIRDYAARHPGPGDVALVVEVADSSIREDRKSLAVYARAGIPSVWLVNLPDGTVEVHTNPTTGTEPAKYNEMNAYGSSGRVPVRVEGRDVGEIAVTDILP